MSEITGGSPAQPCGICSNGDWSLVYHYGGPCPYLYSKAEDFSIKPICNLGKSDWVNVEDVIRIEQLEKTLRFYATAGLKEIFQDGGRRAQAALGECYDEK